MIMVYGFCDKLPWTHYNLQDKEPFKEFSKTVSFSLNYNQYIKTQSFTNKKHVQPEFLIFLLLFKSSR